MNILKIPLLLSIAFAAQTGCAVTPEQDENIEQPVLRAEIITLPAACLIDNVDGAVKVGVPEVGFVVVDKNQEIKYGLYYYIDKGASMKVSCTNGEVYRFNKAGADLTVVFEPLGSE